MWQTYIHAQDIDHALGVLSEKGMRARIVAGATDLMLEIERGQRPGLDTLVDVSRIPGMDKIWLDEHDWIHLGPLVTHNQCTASALLRERGYPLARAAWEVGAPQIRNRGTVAGNLMTASPANDTITPLMALDARLTLRSLRGQREVRLADFYTGVRRTVLQPGEMLVDIAFPALKTGQQGIFLKLGLRRAQAISLVNLAAVLTLDGGQVTDAAITLGAVAPTIIHAEQAETFLTGKALDEASIAQAAELVRQAARPIDDVRASAAYRREMAGILAQRALESIQTGTVRMGFPENPVLLSKAGNAPDEVSCPDAEDLIRCRINGREYTFSEGSEKSLLNLIRDEAGLLGVKEGCAEGECGACTVFLDGKAVMSCLVPAPRAHGAEIVTVEGLGSAEKLHPVQQAFIDAGAVQCGYCTPGFLMSAAKLLEEKPHPDGDEIRQALTGNLCRCTGYYKIVQAVERAALEV